MSGVSEGGFTVAHMAAKGADKAICREVIEHWGADKKTGKLNQDCMTSLSVGSYLTDRLSAIGRYLFHTFFMLGFSLGLLVTTATAVAVFYRWFDSEVMRARLDFSGITLRSIDLAAAFVPAWIILFWCLPSLLVVIANNWTAKKRQVARVAAGNGDDLSRYYNIVRFSCWSLALALFTAWLAQQ